MVLLAVAAAGVVLAGSARARRFVPLAMAAVSFVPLAFGATVDFIVPNRFEYGYGLTPEIVELAARLAPNLIVTVDNGIASVDGVRAAAARGIDVLITDHHLPGPELPAPAIIVNPNQPGCGFASKHVAGVGCGFGR